MEYLIIGILLLLLALIGAPLFSLIGALALYLFTISGGEAKFVIAELTRLADFPSLIAIPLFTFAGYLLAESKAPQRLVNLSQAIVGSVPGGLAVVALFSCAIFTAFTGASGVTIVALGGLLLPIMLKEGYPEKFSLGLLTTSGSLGLLFPPSLPIILYGLVAQISINKLFIAGLVPGTILIILLALYSITISMRSKITKIPFEWKNVLQTIRASAWELPLPIIVIGGIYGGVFTATEAAAVTAFYVLVVEVFIYKDIKLFKDVPRVMQKSMLLVGAIFVVLGTALGLTNYFIDAQIPERLFEWIRQFIDNKYTFLVLLNCVLLIVNMIEIFSAIIIVVPLIIPIANQYGVDPIHLGIIFLLNLEIGYMLPPLGLNLFIGSLRFERPMSAMYRVTIPFMAILLALLLLVTYYPMLSLWLVNLLGVQ
ncbi:MAG: TRAP transporter large permease subunit [Ignavibacteriales bacterium]|nr:TRAP transporter large permease subunit [Ignavibacteriales bacterium]